MKRKTVIFMLCTLLLLCVATPVLAYFAHSIFEQNTPIDYTHTPAVIEVSTEVELVQATNLAAASSDFNSTNMISNSQKRKTITLAADITLSKDLVFRSDCNLNLNGHTLSLEDNQIFIIHSYVGTSYIYDGTISSLNATSINIQVPNGNVLLTDSVQLINVTQTIVEIDEAMVANSALSLAISTLQNYTIQDYIKLNDGTISFSTNENCLFSDVSKGNCIYTMTDLIFLKNFYHFDVSYAYSISDTEYISPTGKVSLPTTGDVTTTLSISATYKNTVKTISMNVHLISDTDSAKEKAAVSSLLEIFSRYEKNENGQYIITSTLNLPLIDTYFNTSFTYYLYQNDVDGKKTEITNSSLSTTFFDRIGTDHVVVNFNTDTTYIGIESGGSKIDIPIAIVDSTIQNNTTYAVEIVKELYGNSIKIEKSTADNNINGYTSQRITSYSSIANPYYESIGVTSITNTLLNNVDETYVISEDTLHYALGFEEPNALQSVFLVVTITFDDVINQLEPKTVKIQVPIQYVDENNNPDVGFSSFRPYYVYFNNQINLITNGYTLQNFEIPFNLGYGFPIYYLTPTVTRVSSEEIITENIPITMTLITQEKEYTMEEFLALSNSELLVIAQSGNAKWRINIDLPKVLIDEAIITLTYHYKTRILNGSSEYIISDWTPFNSTSEFRTHGIVTCGDNGYENQRFTDTLLFDYIRKTIYGETYTQSYLLSSDVSGYSGDLDCSQIQYSDLRGLELLTSASSLNLSNNNASVILNGLSYISEMSSLTSLNLSNCNLYDRSSSNLGLPTGTDNHFIASLQTLTNLEQLDLSNNKIYSFADLSGFVSLKAVYVYNNTFSSNSGWNIINNIITPIINQIYGSQGAQNSAVYIVLKNKGVDVYNVLVDGVPSYIMSDTTNFVSNLLALEYQEYVPEGVSIEQIYSDFSTSISDYAISNAYNEGTESIKFGYIGDDPFTSTTFTLTYTFQVNTGAIFPNLQNVDIVLEFDITRYAL